MDVRLTRELRELLLLPLPMTGVLGCMQECEATGVHPPVTPMTRMLGCMHAVVRGHGHAPPRDSYDEDAGVYACSCTRPRVCFPPVT